MTHRTLKAQRLPDVDTTTAQVQTSPIQHAWYTHTYNRPIFYHAIAACAAWLPRPVRLRLARLIAHLLRQHMPHEEAAVQRNLARILPTASTTEIAHHAQTLFGYFACFFADLLSLNHASHQVQQRYIHDVHGMEHLHTVLATGGGFIAATAHLGNWDLAGRLLCDYGKTVHVVVAPEQNTAIQQVLREQDRPAGLHFCSNAAAGMFVQLLMRLRHGDIVAIQADRATGNRSDHVVSFFGAPARLPLGPFILAGAAQVPVLPCFCLMRPDQRYEIFVHTPLVVQRGHEAHALRQMVGILEHYIAMAPEQWCNFYDVWQL